MVSKSSVLGKRSRICPPEPSFPTDISNKGSTPLTPDVTSGLKRSRTVSLILDGDFNKENVAPLCDEVAQEGTTGSRSRHLRQTSTEYLAKPSSVRSDSRVASESRKPALPPTPALLVPLHASIRALLRPVCNGTAPIAGRSTERAVISDFLSPFLVDTPPSGLSPSSLFISGPPGTGKTALVNAVLDRLLSDEVGFKLCVVNCMTLDGVEALWIKLIEEFSVNASSKRRKTSSRKGKGRELAEEKLVNAQIKFILVLDELDHISTPTALSAIFSLARDHPTALRILGIANTHTLTANSSIPINDKSLSKTLHFAPYTPSELLDILKARLSSLYGLDNGVHEFLPTSTLTLLSKKVAALTGDARALFEVLRIAVDLASHAAKAAIANNPDVNPLAPPPTVKVTPANILAALKAHAPATTPKIGSTTAFPSPGKGSLNEMVTTVRNLGMHARLVLMSLLLAGKRLDAGLNLSTLPFSMHIPSKADPPRTPTKQKMSPVKRTPSKLSTPSKSAQLAGAIDAPALYSFYSAALTRGDNGVFVPITRGEFDDVLGMLESSGLVSLSSSSSGPRTPVKRASSFPTLNRNSGTANGIQMVRLGANVRVDEALRGLGVDASKGLKVVSDIREEEVIAIWTREMSKLAKEAKAVSSLRTPTLTGVKFDEAEED